MKITTDGGRVKVEVPFDRRKSRERYDAYLRGEYIPPENPPQISNEIQDKMLDMFAAVLAKEYRKELEQQAHTGS